MVSGGPPKSIRLRGGQKTVTSAAESNAAKVLSCRALPTERFAVRNLLQEATPTLSGKFGPRKQLQHRLVTGKVSAT